MLELNNVSKTYGGQYALHPFSLAVSEGTTTALLGTSGCGKSTILRLIMRLIAPDSGEILLNGNAVTSQNITATRHRIGYVIQEGGLFPHLTLKGNVTLLARHLSWDEERIEARLKELAQLTRLQESWLDRYPTQVSGGQRQRVALMRALFLDPELLLLDEPLGALDPIIHFELQQELKQIFASLKKTVLLVTHNLRVAGNLADQIVLLDAGHKVQQGTMSELIKRPATEFVSRFVTAQQETLA